MSTPTYTSLLDAEQHLKESVTLLSNYLSLGQFELARATLAQLFNDHPQKAIELVSKLITQVPKSWQQSESVPSAAHLSWLCLVEYLKLVKNKEELPPDIDVTTKEIEFDLLLDRTFAGFENADDVKLEIREYYNSINQTLESRSSGSTSRGTPGSQSKRATLSLSQTVLARLRQAFSIADKFELAHRLCEHLNSVLPLFRETTKQLYALRVQVINEIFDEGTASAIEMAIDLIKFLTFPKEAVPDGADQLFEKIIRLYFEPSSVYGSLVATQEARQHWQRRVYGALVILATSEAGHAALRHFLKIERSIMKNEPEKELLPFPFHALNQDTQMTDSERFEFWSLYHNYLVATNKHFVEYVITKALDLACARKWSECRQLLKPFGKLKPVLLLMTWDKFGTDVAAREALLSLFWSDKSVTTDESIISECNALEYHIKVVRWCTNQLLSHAAKDSIQIGQLSVSANTKPGTQVANIVSELLNNHSIAYVLHAYMREVPTDELIALILSSPDTSDVGKHKQRIDVLLVRSYATLKCIADLVNDTAFRKVDKERVESYLAEAQRQLSAIDDPICCLQLVESIFSFMFLKSSAWKSNEFGFLVHQLRAGNKQVEDGPERVESEEFSENSEKEINDCFIMDSVTVLPLITFLRTNLERINKSIPSDMINRAAELEAKLKEAQWRAELISTSAVFDSSSSFMNLMVASPQSLIIRCIREKDFATAKEIIKFFGLEDTEHNDLTAIAQAVYNLRESLAKLDETLTSSLPSIEKIAPQLTDIEKFTMAADIAICSGANQHQSLHYLKVAKNFLANLTKRTSSSTTALIDTDVLAHLNAYLDRLETLLTTDLSTACAIGSVAIESALAKRLSLSESFPSEQSALRGYLQLHSSLRAAAESLHAALNANETDTEALLRKILSSLDSSLPEPVTPAISAHSLPATESAEVSITSSVPQSPSVILVHPVPYKSGVPYLHAYVKQLLTVGNVLKDDHFLGTRNYFDLMKQTPRQLLAALVFESKNYKKAEKLAAELDLDLVAVVLECLANTSSAAQALMTSASSSSLTRSTSSSMRRTSSRRDVSLFGTSVPSSTSELTAAGTSFGLHSSLASSHLESTTLDSELKLHRLQASLNPIEKQYTLNMDLIEYLRRANPIAAVIACILRSPVDRFDPSFFELSLNVAKKHYPALYNWLSFKTREVLLFYTAVLLKNAESIPFTATPSNPLQSDLNNEEMRSGKRPAVDELQMSDMLFGSYKSRSGEGFSPRKHAPSRQYVFAHVSSALYDSPQTSHRLFYPRRHRKHNYSGGASFPSDDDISVDDDEESGELDTLHTPGSLTPSSFGSYRVRTRPFDIDASPASGQQWSRRASDVTTTHSHVSNELDVGMNIPAESIPSSGNVSEAHHSFVTFFSAPQLGEASVLERAIENEEDRAEYESLLWMDDLASEQAFHQKIIDRLVLSGRIALAASFADIALPDGCPDQLLRMLIAQPTQDPSQSWKCIMRIRDKAAAAALVLEHVRNWDIDPAMYALHVTFRISNLPKPFPPSDMLHMCSGHLAKRSEHASTLSQIENLRTRLLVYKEIIHRVPDKWRKWQSLDAVCTQNLQEVVQQLMDLRQHDLARKLADLFHASAVKTKIEEKFLLHLLTEKNDIKTVKERLVSLGDDSVRMAESLLEQVKTNKERLFLIQYLREKKKSFENDSLTTTELGVRILLQLPADLQPLFQNFINRPHVIIESLLMSEQTAVLAQIFREIPQVRNDEMIITYAKKALDTSRLLLTASDITSSTASDSQKRKSGTSIPISLQYDTSGPPSQRGFESAAAATKPTYQYSTSPTQIAPIALPHADHSYPSAPNHQLATAILDLCSSATLAAAQCIELTDQLSQRLTAYRDRLEIVRIIQQLLYYAKLRLTKEMDAIADSDEPQTQPPDPTGLSPHHLITLCDTLLNRIDLMLQLLFSASDIIVSLSLSALADPQKMRQIRDKLVEQDRLELAQIVATKCGIETEPILAAKGLQMLQAGKYQEAKQLFRLCLVSSSPDEDAPIPSRPAGPQGSVASRPIADNSLLLQSIIRVLESGSPMDSNDMRRKYADLVAKVQSNPMLSKKLLSYNEGSQSPEGSSKALLSLARQKQPTGVIKRKDTLDTVRYMQCIYYLQRYGTVDDLLQFWLRHKMIEDALRHVVNSRLDPKYFMDVVLRALRLNLMSRVKEAISKLYSIDSKKIQDYLLHACKHFNQHGMFKILLEFQLMMKDYIRAGLTCVKIAQSTQSFDAHMNYLNLAKKYFQLGLESPLDTQPPGTASVGTKNDMSRYMRTVNLQIKVSQFFEANQKNMPEPLPPDFTLFGNNSKKAAIAEMLILMHNFDLAFSIVQEYRLPSKVYASAAVKMAQKKQTKKIDELFKHVKLWFTDAEMDQCLLHLVQIYVAMHDDTSQAETYIGRMKSDATKVEGLMICRKFKQAYLLAVKLQDIRLVQKLKEAAKRYDQKGIYELCEKFLQSRGVSTGY